MGKKENVWVFVILIGIIIFHMINNYVISSIDRAPFFHDIANYINTSFRVYSLLCQYKFFDVFFGTSYHYPPLFYILSFPFYLLFGLSQKSALMTNFIFIAVLVFSVYGIGKFLHSKKVGILAAFIVMSFPGVFALSRTYMHDFALIAMVTLSIYCLLKTRNFTQRKFSVFLGLATGLGMAIKPPFVIFFLGPFCYYLFISFKQRNDRQVLFGKIKNFIIFSMISLFLIAFFYIPLPILNRIFFATSVDMYTADFEYFSLKNILNYFESLWMIQILYFYFILFLLGVVLFLKSNKKYKPLLFLWLLIPYLFFTFYMGHNGVGRFTAPYLPAIALITSITLFDLQRATIKRVLIFLTVIIGLFQFFLISYVPSGWSSVDYLNKKSFLYTDRFYIDRYFTASAPVMFERPHAYATDYGLREIIDYIKKSDRINKQNQINFFDTSNGLLTQTIEYLIYQDDSLSTKRFYYHQPLCKLIFKPEGATEDCVNEVVQALNDTDFLILSSDTGDDFIDLKNLISKDFKLIKKVDLENNKDLYIFENKMIQNAKVQYYCNKQ